MAEPADGLAGAADALTKLSSLFSSALLKPAEKCHDLIHTTKAKHGPRFEDFIQRSALLIYIAADPLGPQLRGQSADELARHCTTTSATCHTQLMEPINSLRCNTTRWASNCTM